MKNLLIVLASSIVIIACSDSKGTDKQTLVSQEENSEHMYRCPMHHEITGKKGDTCPKCGMKLELSDESVPTNAEYYMQVTLHPATVEPGNNVTLSFTPKIKGKEGDSVALDIEHEKKIHLILVNEDLSWFDHIHPEYTADGSYKVTEKFPTPGKYIAFADYKPSGANHVIDKIAIDVKGNSPAAKTYTTEKLSGTSSNYSFELKSGSGKLITEATMDISGIIKKNGKPIDANLLDNYLGAKAHFVMISLNEKEYLHVHPNIKDGKFQLHTQFETPGIYRGWVQFNAEGKLHTIDFTLDVKGATVQEKHAAENNKSLDEHAAHAH